jgi:hypothetical protein
MALTSRVRNDPGAGQGRAGRRSSWSSRRFRMATPGEPPQSCDQRGNTGSWLSDAATARLADACSCCRPRGSEGPAEASTETCLADIPQTATVAIWCYWALLSLLADRAVTIGAPETAECWGFRNGPVAVNPWTCPALPFVLSGSSASEVSGRAAALNKRWRRHKPTSSKAISLWSTLTWPNFWTMIHTAPHVLKFDRTDLALGVQLEAQGFFAFASDVGGFYLTALLPHCLPGNAQ